MQSKHFKSIPEAELLQKVSANSKVVSMPLAEAVDTSVGTVGCRLLQAIEHFASEQPSVIAVCGSLFVAADAREALFR